MLTFLDEYFNAINTHNYQEYLSLLDAQEQQNETPAAFRAGFRTTTDSDATLVGLTSTGTGLVAASITFTSHQAPADSATHTSCTSWDITLYLGMQGGGYVMQLPPPGYKASYRAC